MNAKYSKLKTAIITTLWYLPALLWQQTFIAMYLQDERHPDYFEPLTLAIFIMMVAVTFTIALKSERINKNRIHVLSIITLTIGVVLIFDKNVYAQLGFFVLYSYIFVYPFKEFIQRFSNRVPEFEVWVADNEDFMGNNRYVDGVEDEELNYFVESFYTFEEATKFIEEKVDTVIADMASNARSVEKLKTMDPTQQVSYFIKTKSGKKVFFRTYDYIQKRADDIFSQLKKDEKKEKSNINSFEDMLKRGNLPDDDREAPNYLMIKNRQYDKVDMSNNNVDSIIALSSEEFNEFVSSVDTNMLLVYLSTMSEPEMQKFYKYLDDVVKLKEGVEAPSAKEQFLSTMQNLKTSNITDESRARATLETPLAINYAKNIYHKTVAYGKYVRQNYYLYKEDTKMIRFEATLTSVIWDRMSEIPNSFEQVLTLFKDVYDENNSEHQKILTHLGSRFGYLVATLDKLVQLTQNRSDTSLHWFVSVLADKNLIDTKHAISIDETNALESDKKLINFLTLMFASICANDEDAYLENLINVINTLFEWCPVNREACEYAMVEMMKSVAIKKVNVENANSFIEFFGELPRFYKVLDYNRIYELKELIVHTLANHKPQDNKIFDNPDVKNKLILLNYLVDMEDLYYESGHNI